MSYGTATSSISASTCDRSGAGPERSRRMIRPAAMVVTALVATMASSAEARQAAGPFPPPAAKYQFTVEKDVMVPMRDGVRLATDLYRPTGAGERLPVILMRTPYNKATYNGAVPQARIFAGQGYIAVVQ